MTTNRWRWRHMGSDFTPHGPQAVTCTKMVVISLTVFQSTRPASRDSKTSQLSFIISFFYSLIYTNSTSALPFLNTIITAYKLYFKLSRCESPSKFLCTSDSHLYKSPLMPFKPTPDPPPFMEILYLPSAVQNTPLSLHIPFPC